MMEKATATPPEGWEKAMKPPTILNRGISIDELLTIAQESHQYISITARPDGLYISVMDADEVSDEEE